MRAAIRGCVALVLLVSAMLIAAPVCGQQFPQPKVPSRPYRSLFGNDDVRTPSLHAVDLTLSVDGGIDNGYYGSSATPADGTAQQAAQYQQVYAGGAELAYARRGRQVAADLLGTTSLPYYSLFPDEPKRLAYGASGNLSVLSARNSAAFVGSFLHSPYYVSALDPSAGPGVGNGYYGRASALNPNNISNAGTALTRKLGRRTAMVGGYTFDRTYFTEEVRWNQSQRAFASIDRRLSRRTTVTGGYAYRATDYTTNDSLSSSSSHDLDMRFTYTREAPQGKSTSLRAGLGSSFVDEFGRQYHGWRWLVGFDHAVSTRWILGANYGRDLRYLGYVQQPIWSDEAAVTAAGFVNSRVKLAFGVNYSNGRTVSNAGVQFDTYWATTRLQLAVTQWAAVTADYIYYRYDYPPGIGLPAGMPHQLDRQRVQFGARFWVPLARAGRSGAARTPDNP